MKQQLQLQKQQLQAKEHQLEQLLQSHEQLVAKKEQLLIMESQDANGDFLPALSAKSKLSNWINEQTNFLNIKSLCFREMKAPFFTWNVFELSILTMRLFLITCGAPYNMKHAFLH